MAPGNRCWYCGDSILGQGPFCEPCLAHIESNPTCPCGAPAVTKVSDGYGSFTVCATCASESDLSWAAEHGASRVAS